MQLALAPLDVAAFGLFLVCWLFYEPLLKVLGGRRGAVINTDMTVIRTMWMRNMVRRENRFMDGQLLGHTLSSASFFASSNLILIAAIAGALFGGEHTFRSVSNLVVIKTSSRILFEMQLGLILVSLARGLLDLIWGIRQMNYTFAFIGAAPLDTTPEQQRKIGDIAARTINPALSSFNRGVRAYYFALAAAAWLFGPIWFMAATIGAVGLLLWRQRSSQTAAAIHDLRRLLEEEPSSPGPARAAPSASGSL